MRLVSKPPPEGWPAYNQTVLSKTWVLWRTEQQALSICPWCIEVLVWPDLTEEAVTLEATQTVLEDLKRTVVPMLIDSLRVRAVPLVDKMLRQEDPGDPAQAKPLPMPQLEHSNQRVMAALSQFTQRHPRK